MKKRLALIPRDKGFSIPARRMHPIIVLISILFLLSCNWRDKYNRITKKHTTTSQADTSHWLPLLKSYEPKAYKGKVPNDFYSYYGIYDFWRYPLVYPYSIVCIDVTDYGSIVSDKDKTDFRAGGGIEPLTGYFDRFILDRNIFVGSRCKYPFDKDTISYVERYFILSFSDGRQTDVAGKKNLVKKLKELNFTGDTTFLTIRDYSAGL